MRKTVLLSILFVVFLGCDTDENDNEFANVQIQISNISDFDFDNVNVSTTGEIMNFENVASNSKSDFQVFEIAYRFAFIEFLINGEVFTFQPIDFVGETPLENGNYAYEIDVNPDSEFEKVILELRTE